MKKKMRVGVKAAWIGGVCVVIAAILTVLLSKSNSPSHIQKINEQKTDSGSINNYNAGRDVKIENNTYNGILQNTDSIKRLDTGVKNIKAPIVKPVSDQKTNIHEQTNVTSNNQSGGQTAKEIINNNN